MSFERYSVISTGTRALFLQVVIELLLNVLLSGKWQAFTKTGAAGIAAVCVAKHHLAFSLGKYRFYDL